VVRAAQQPPVNQIFVSVKVFTGRNPFEGCHPITTTVKIIGGERPPRPDDPTLTDDVWALVGRCWAQEPQSRPKMGRVLQDLASSLLQSLGQFTKSSPGFQVALSQFYDNVERYGCLSRLRLTELKRFVNFLDDVWQLFGFSHSDPDCDFLFRCYRLRD